MEGTRQNGRSGLPRLRDLFLSLLGRFSRRTALIAGATLVVAPSALRSIGARWSRWAWRR